MASHEKLQHIQVKPDSFECSITADITVFGYVDNKLKVLLLEKSVGDYHDHWMVPGGVMEAHETVEDCAAKVLHVLTGFKDIHFEQVKTYSTLNRHPLKRVITVCFYALVKPENHPLTLHSGVQRIQWFDVDELPELMGFDHKQLVNDAYLFVRSNLRDRLVVGELLPKQFTLPELQNLYEHILNVKLDKRNFRKKMFQMDILQSTGKKKIGIKGGPLLYEVKQD